MFVTNPCATGSETCVNTIGMVRVARCIASRPSSAAWRCAGFEVQIVPANIEPIAICVEGKAPTL
jgi:hypothetical protein